MISDAYAFYIVTLLVLLGANLIAAWALNLQHGVAGVWNFGLIVFQAVGAYTAAVVTLGPSDSLGGFQDYIVGLSLPWPLPILLAGVVGGLLALAVGAFALRPKGRDYQALVLLVMSAVAILFVSSQNWLFNGTAGLAGVPKPFEEDLNWTLAEYGWIYLGLTTVVCGMVYLAVHRIAASPWGRRLRAQRENPDGAAAIGINVFRERLTVFVVGGALAGVSGAVLVQFIGTWSPEGWEYGLTFLYFTAIIVGGLGNNAGVLVGVLLVWTVLQESVRYLPDFANPTVTANIQGILIGLIIIAFLWFRPQGLLPERKRRLTERVSHSPAQAKVADGQQGGEDRRAPIGD